MYTQRSKAKRPQAFSFETDHFWPV